METTYKASFDSPTGPLTIYGNEKAITALRFEETEATSEELPSYFEETRQQLDAYFKGDLQEFNLPLAPEGTEFQQKVWNELLNIPFGETVSYLDIALKLGDENATRAVGAANGKNPIAIVIPCHRVIATNGKLTGYAYGLETKKWLLRWESEQKPIGLFS